MNIPTKKAAIEYESGRSGEVLDLIVVGITFSVRDITAVSLTEKEVAPKAGIKLMFLRE